MKNDIISIDNIKDALLRSGYLMENRVLNFFQAAGLNSITNHHFPADEEGKFREIDIIASMNFGNIPLDKNLKGVSIHVHFVAECINALQPIGVFENLASPEFNREALLFTLVNGDEDLRERSSLLWSEALDRLTSSKAPAKQYCGFIQKNQKGAEWMASHREDFHRTLTKLTQFVKYDLKQIESNWSGRRPQNCRIEIIIPLIILQCEILEIKNNTELELVKVPYYNFNAPYDEYTSVSIGLVNEEYLKDYFENIETKLKMSFEFLKRELLYYYK